MSIEPQSLALGLSAGVTVGALIGGLITQIFNARRLQQARTACAVLESQLKNEEQLLLEREKSLMRARHELASTFSALADQSLRMNADTFLKIAREHLGQHQLHAQHDLNARTQAIELLVKPLQENLQAARQEIDQMEKRRATTFGDIERYLKSMGEGQRSLQENTHQLVGALRGHRVRGRWGELSLRRLVELAGMVEHCDFQEQSTFATEDAWQRPDMLIRLPEKRTIVVDAKVPLDGYLDSLEASDEAARKEALLRHAKQVRERMRTLANKRYWEGLSETPPFVVLFLPGDPFLSEALSADPDLLEQAFSQNVIIATPSSLLALLKAIALGWQHARVQDNVERILELAQQLQKRFTKFSEYLARTGVRLKGSVEAYNLAVGQFERGVLPHTDRLAELGVSKLSTQQQPTRIEQTVRPLSLYEFPNDADSSEETSEESPPPPSSSPTQWGRKEVGE